MIFFLLARHSLIVINHSLLLFVQPLLLAVQLYRLTAKAGHNVRRCFLFCFLSSLPILPQPPLQCLASICHFSTLNLHFMTGAGLPIRMIGEVAWDPKRRRAGGLSVYHCSMDIPHRITALQRAWPIQA
jgi:hypothetical protein